jgi:hypothetical protein
MNHQAGGIYLFGNDASLNDYLNDQIEAPGDRAPADQSFVSPRFV